MPTSSITHNFEIIGNEAAERFANAIEESYQRSLKEDSSKYDIHVLTDPEEIKKYFENLEV